MNFPEGTTYYHLAAAYFVVYTLILYGIAYFLGRDPINVILTGYAFSIVVYFLNFYLGNPPDFYNGNY